MFDSLLSISRRLMPGWMYARLIGNWNQEGFKKYFKNTSWMFLGRILHLLAAFFVGAWLARYLGPENYGTLNYAFAFVGIFTFIAGLGIGSILSRDLIKYPEKRDELLGTSFGLLLCGGIVAFFLVFVSAFVFEPSMFNRILIILYSTSFLWSAFGIIPIFFESTVQAKKNVRVSIVALITSSLLKIFLIISGKGLVLLITIFVFETLLSASLSILIYKKNGYRFKTWRFKKKTAKKILSGGFLLMLAGGASFMFMRIDQVMVRGFLGEESVGLYAAAVRLVEIWYFIPGLICASLFPAIVNAKKVGEYMYNDRLRKLYALLASAAIAIALPSTILAPWIISLVFGGAYTEAVPVFQIYIWSGVGLFILWGLQQYFLTENKLTTIFFLYLFAMVINITLNVFLIPRLGLTGAAWATLISYSLIPLLTLGLLKFKNSHNVPKNIKH